MENYIPESQVCHSKSDCFHTADCERGFSKQNLIKSKSGNRIGDAALNRLMLVSIEGKPLEEFDFVESLCVESTEGQKNFPQGLE